MMVMMIEKNISTFEDNEMMMKDVRQNENVFQNRNNGIYRKYHREDS